MPRKKGSVNKSAAVRELLSANPDRPVKEIVETMGSRGLRVTPNLVYYLKAKMRAGKRKKARQRAMAAVAAGNGSRGNPIELVRKVKELASEVGGYNKLKELAEILAN